MSHMAPGEQSPAIDPDNAPDVPYEAEQGTGDAEKTQEEVEREQGKETAPEEPPGAEAAPPGRGAFIAPSDAAPHTDVLGRPIRD
jgi:hypothetical protein